MLPERCRSSLGFFDMIHHRVRFSNDVPLVLDLEYYYIHAANTARFRRTWNLASPSGAFGLDCNPSPLGWKSSVPVIITMPLRKSWGWSGRVEREVDCQVQPNFIEPRIGAKLDRLHHTPCSFDLPPLPTLPTERFYLVCRLCCLAASLAMTLQYAEPTIDPPSLRISSAIALRAAYRS